MVPFCDIIINLAVARTAFKSVFVLRLFLGGCSLAMARRGRINTETALTMLDTSFSGSEFDVVDSDDSDLRRDDESIESVEERGMVGDDGGSAVRDDNQLDPDGGSSTFTTQTRAAT